MNLTGKGKVWRRRLAAGLALALAVLVNWPAPGAALDRQVVRSLRRHGGMSAKKARGLTRHVSSEMRANARAGGDHYDPLRQAVGEALFPDGAGRTRAEYEDRLAQVLQRLSQGLTRWALERLFPPEPTSLARCMDTFSLSERACHALMAAAERTSLDAVRERARPAPEAVLAEARQAYRDRRYAEAADRYRELTRRKPREVIAFAGLGRALLAAGDTAAALEAFSRAVALAPRNANVHVLLGEAHLVAGAPDQARSAFREALSLKPEHPGAKKALARLASSSGAGGRNEARSDSGPARMAKPRPAERDASECGTMCQVARRHQQAGRHRQALRSYQEAAARDPNNAEAFAGIAAARLALGDASGAARAYQMAIRLRPDSPRLHTALGDAYAALGDGDSARAAYRRALGLDGKYAAALRGLRHLQRRGLDHGDNRAQASALAASTTPTSASTSTNASTPPWRKAGQAPPPLFGDTRDAAGEPNEAQGPSKGASPATSTATSPKPQPAGEPATPEPQPKGEPAPSAAAASASGVARPPQERTPSVPEAQTAADEAPRQSPEPAAAAASAGENPQLDSGFLASLVNDPLGSTSAAPAAGAARDVPSKQEILSVMKPLKPRVAQCLPGHEGVVTFRITVRGATGEVTEVSTASELEETAEGACAIEVIRTAQFPEFSRETLSIGFPFKR